MTIKVKYAYGDILYLKSDPEQQPMHFAGIMARPGQIKYILNYCGDEYEVYDFEISEEQDTMKLLDIKAEE